MTRMSTPVVSVVLAARNEAARIGDAIGSIQEQTWAETANAASQYPSEELQRESWRTHAALVKLIDEGDSEGVRKLAAAHLRATQSIVLERFGGEVVDSSSLVAVQAFRSL